MGVPDEVNGIGGDQESGGVAHVQRQEALVRQHSFVDEVGALEPMWQRHLKDQGKAKAIILSLHQQGQIQADGQAQCPCLVQEVALAMHGRGNVIGALRDVLCCSFHAALVRLKGLARKHLLPCSPPLPINSAHIITPALLQCGVRFILSKLALHLQLIVSLVAGACRVVFPVLADA